VACRYATLKFGGRVRLGDDIVLTLSRIGDGACRIGITAPKVIPVHRIEIQARIERRRREGAEAAPPVLPSWCRPDDGWRDG
jgi:carbon storage regulator CsrA